MGPDSQVTHSFRFFALMDSIAFPPLRGIVFTYLIADSVMLVREKFCMILRKSFHLESRR